MALIKGKKKTFYVLINIFRASVLYEELRFLFPEPGCPLRGF
jgi:hypothetical protein